MVQVRTAFDGAVESRSCRPPRKHILGSLFFGGVAQLGLDTCLSAATDKDVRRFDWFCNLLAILSRPAVTLAFLRMGDALTLAQAALSASALVLGVLLAYADVICSKLCETGARRRAEQARQRESAALPKYMQGARVACGLRLHCGWPYPLARCLSRPARLFDLWLQHKGLRGTLYFEVT